MITRMDVDASVEIWNRAASAGGGPTPGAGDRALSSALRFHGMVMSGGLDHALDVLTTDEIAAAADSYRYLQLGPVADLIARAQAAFGRADDDALEQLDDEYDDLVPEEQTLGDHFEAALATHPEDFAPVS